MKKTKATPQAHTPRSSKGMGDFYGTGIKQKVGTIRESMMTQKISSEKLGNPPKTLA